MPKELKRVLIARNAYEWQYGGAEQFAYNLAVVMQEKGIEPIVVTRVPELLRHCNRDRIRTYRNIWFKNETHRRWMPVYYLLSPLLVGQYAWMLLVTRADLLIVSSRDDQIFGTMAARLLGVPVVWFDHADMKHIVARPFRFLSRAYYWALAQADAVIMTSQAEQEKISEGLPASKQSRFVLINNGALKRSGTAMKRPAGKKIVAYAGRLDKDKGIFDLAEAAVEVVRRVPEVEFWLAGKGPYEDELKAKLAELGVAEHFKLLGHLDNVQNLLLAADVFVYPTHHDAAPLAPVEALLAGVPVVASRIGGIPEMVPPEAGILLPIKEPTKLAETLSDLLSDEKELAKLREGAKAAGSTRTFEYVLNEHYLPLFRKLIKARS